MNPPNPSEEPLKNVELESAILGLRMTLTPEETAEAREKFFDLLRVSPMAVPTSQPVPTNPDGSIIPNAPINLIVINTPEGLSGVPVFTTLAGLRTNMPQVENGMFLTGADLGNILGESEHKLLVVSPDIPRPENGIFQSGHIEVETQELKQLALLAQQQMASQQESMQQAVRQNLPLEEALAALDAADNGINRETVIRAFLEGFCRYPVLTEADGDAEALVLSQDAPEGSNPGPELALLTIEGALPAFSSEEAILTWDSVVRPAIPILGHEVARFATQAEVTAIHLNAKGPHSRTLQVKQGQITLS